MAKTHTYLVSFSPAEKQAWGGFTVKLSLIAGAIDHEVSASSFASLEVEVRRLAKAFGQDCSPHVRLKDEAARKPAGLDAWKSTINFIEFVPEPVEQAAAAE
jgi:hypothetical protein